MTELFDRAERLLGADAMRQLARTRVIIFGVGGVGSWCAEALIRTGVGHLTIVDSDEVVLSNVNRQLQATTLTVGAPKVEAMRNRLLEINPNADIVALPMRFTAETADRFNFEDFDFVIDAIDSLADKALLILKATACRSTTLFSSMGAARKLDPSRVQVKEFWQVKGCPLAAALRSRFKRSGQFPARKFKAVFSDEVLPSSSAPGEPNGSLVHITAVWGMTLASLVINRVLSSSASRFSKQ